MRTIIYDKMNKKTRNDFADIMKAFGIISVVIGHSFSLVIPVFDVSVTKVVYTYHLMIFFFVSGYCLKIKECDEAAVLGKQFIKITLIFEIYNVIFVLLHNSFVKIGLLNDVSFDHLTVFACLIRGFFWDPNELFLSAFWFLKFHFSALMIWLLFNRFLKKHVKNKKTALMLKISFCFVCYFIGLICIKNSLIFFNYGEKAFLAVPVLFIGEIAFSRKEQLARMLHWYAAIPALIILFVILKVTGKGIEIAAGEIICPELFYPVTFLGIFFCAWLAHILSSLKYNNWMRRGFSLIGKNSMHIMALHFMGIKITDWIYSRIHGMINIEEITRWPHSLYGINGEYLILAVAGPVILVEGWRLLRKRVSVYVTHKLPFDL